MPDFEEMEKAMNNVNKDPYIQSLYRNWDEQDRAERRGYRWRQTSCSCRYYDNNSPCAYCDPVDGGD